MIIVLSKFPVFTKLPFQAMAFFPFILVKHKKLKLDKFLLNHEKIHLRQQAELLIIFFYLLYILEFLYQLIRKRNAMQAYYAISFEKEAYENECDLTYLKNRKWFSNYRYFEI